MVLGYREIWGKSGSFRQGLSISVLGLASPDGVLAPEYAMDVAPRVAYTSPTGKVGIGTGIGLWR